VKRALLVLLIAAGCGACGGAAEYGVPDQPDVKPGDNAFAKSVWVAYGNDGFDRPALAYVEGDALNCTGQDGTRGFLEPDGLGGHECDLGVWEQIGYTARIAWNNERQARRSIVHEFCHATYGDTGHQSFCRMTPDGIIEQIRARLAP
jgi:hypothetical protein